MQRNIVETVLGAVVLLVAAGFVFFFYRTTDIKPATGYVVTAEFDKIDGLEAGSPVRIGGVKVGQVLGFALDKKNYRAIVRMNIDNGIDLPLDTSAVISSAGLLDGKFLTLQPGADEEMIKPDGSGRIDFTQSTPSLEQLLGQFIFAVSKDKNKSAGDEDAAPEESRQETPEEEEPEGSRENGAEAPAEKGGKTPEEGAPEEENL